MLLIKRFTVEGSKVFARENVYIPNHELKRGPATEELILSKSEISAYMSHSVYRTLISRSLAIKEPWQSDRDSMPSPTKRRNFNIQKKHTENPRNDF